MSLRECENLRSYLISNGQYKKTSKYKDNIQQGNVEVIPVVLETIESIMTDRKEEPISRLNALRLLKECVELDNQAFNLNVENGLLNALNGFAIQLDRKTLLKQNPSQQEEKISMSFYILSLECIKVWAHWYPQHKGKPSQFFKVYSNLKTSGFKFPQKLNFFKDIDLYRFNPTARVEYLHKNIKEQVEILKNLPENEDSELAYSVLKELDSFLRYSSEIAQKNHDEIPEQITRDIYGYQQMVAQLHQNLKDYKKGNVNYFFMKNQVISNINNFESATHQRSSQPFLSHKSLSPNSSEDFDLKCDNWMQMNSMQNIQVSQSYLDERQINNIIYKNQINNGSSISQKNAIETSQSIDAAAESDFNKYPSIQQDSKSIVSSKYAQQVLHKNMDDEIVKRLPANAKNFNFTEQQQIESLEEHIAVLEKNKEQIELKLKGQTEAIELLITENKKLQNLLDQKQDDIDLLESKKTYFSYSTDYQTLLCTHQKLEQDYNELVYKQDNFEHEKELLNQENEHLKIQQETLKEMTTTQKDTIKELQVRIIKLAKDNQILEDERENFKKDCERKYQINQLLTLQQVSKNEQTISYNRMDVSGKGNNSPLSSNSVRFNEKDFMRGQTVAKNDLLFAFLNDQEEEINSYTYKLGCLRSSINIYENDFIKVLITKVDSDEIKNIQESTNRNPIPIHMGLQIQVLNKSNINIKHFQIIYQSNNSLKIINENANSQFAAYQLNASNIFQERIFIETNTVPFQIPSMSIKYESNFIKQTVEIALPITINGMIDYEMIKASSLNDMIGMWNNSSSDTIYKSSVFTANKQLVNKKASLHQFFPTFTHVQSSSINFYELFGLVKIPLLNNISAAIKITLVNDRFICFQIKHINNVMKSLNGGEAQPQLKNIQTNTLQFIIQTYQELFQD